jgi:hypothetical protein
VKDFENPAIKGKSLEELIDGLIDKEFGVGPQPGSVVHEQMKLAIQAKMIEQLAAPRKWAGVAAGAAVVSALMTVVSVIVNV